MPALCLNCGKVKHIGSAHTVAKCMNCSSSHAASSKECDQYLLELAYQTKDKLHFKEWVGLNSALRGTPRSVLCLTL